MPAQLITASAPERMADQLSGSASPMSSAIHSAIDRSAGFGRRATPVISYCLALSRDAMADPIRPVAPIRIIFILPPALEHYDSLPSAARLVPRDPADGAGRFDVK